MPHQELTHRFQKALLWIATEAAPGVPAFDVYGQHIRSTTSTELTVRWENRRAEMLDPLGNTIAVDAVVHVVTDIPVGSVMWEGSQEDLEEEEAGTQTGNTLVPSSRVMEVVAVGRIPDLKNRAIRRIIGLKRYREGMPNTS